MLEGFLQAPKLSTQDDMRDQFHNAKDDKEDTPLHFASMSGGNVSVLLEAGANIEAKSGAYGQRWTPLHVASSKGPRSTLTSSTKKQSKARKERSEGKAQKAHFP